MQAVIVPPPPPVQPAMQFVFTSGGLDLELAVRAVNEAGAGSVSHIASIAAIFIFWFSPAV